MIDLIEKTLLALIPFDKGGLYECAAYSLEGGKRLRPQLTLAVAQTYDYPIEKALTAACTLELVHTYSLIHDDLPCMDNDDMRRNRPSLHKAYSESSAVLAGNFLLVYAFEILSQISHLSSFQKNTLILTLAKRIGLEGLIGGQFLDIAGAEDTFIEMRSKKTAALITAALEFGGIMANVDDLTPLQRIGEHLGLAFQLVDDILDADGAVILFGQDKVQRMAEDHFYIAEGEIATLPKGAPLLAALAKEMVFRLV